LADPLAILQPAVGVILFAACGWALTLAAFKEGDIDAVERAAFALAFALVIPTLAVLFLNLVLQIRFSAFLAYAVYIVLACGAWFYSQRYNKPAHHAHPHVNSS
jgi:uncharacterized membrane protein